MIMAKKTAKTAKPTRVKPLKPSPKSDSLRILVTPEQRESWQGAANIAHEGNLSGFIRWAVTARADQVHEVERVKEAKEAKS